MSTTLDEKLATPHTSSGRAQATTKQLLERFGVVLPLGANDAVVITGNQRESWVKVAKDVWEMTGAVRL